MSGRRRGQPNVNPDQDQHRGNRLLAALRPRDYALLEPHLQIVPIGEGELLHLPGDEIEQVYFLHRGIVSLMAISAQGEAISTASVGSEGAIGTIAGTGFVRAFTRAMVQAAGVASRIAVLTDTNARLGADVDRYSFIVVDLHHLLLAGLPAHFESYMPSHAVRSPPSPAPGRRRASSAAFRETNRYGDADVSHRPLHRDNSRLSCGVRVAEPNGELQVGRAAQPKSQSPKS